MEPAKRNASKEGAQVLFMDYLTCLGYNPPKASIRIIASSSSRLRGCYCLPFLDPYSLEKEIHRLYHQQHVATLPYIRLHFRLHANSTMRKKLQYTSRLRKYKNKWQTISQGGSLLRTRKRMLSDPLKFQKCEREVVSRLLLENFASTIHDSAF